MAEIEIEGLTKSFGQFRALDNLNLYVEEKDIFGFLGPNGSGKSTTINCILGLIKPDSGKIRVCGIDVEENPLEVRRVCGYLPDNYGFYGNMTAIDNLKYFSEFYGGISRDAIEELLALVGLSHAAEKKVSEFSRGMKQRLGLAQAILNDPKVVFLDEPTYGLDPQGIADFQKIMKDLQKKGKTIFFSSHILSEVKEVCDTVGIIYRGRMLRVGKISELCGSLAVVVQTEPRADEGLLKRFGRVSYDEKRDAWIVEVEKDCRVELSKHLFENGYVVKELRLKVPNLEEFYFRLVRENEGVNSG